LRRYGPITSARPVADAASTGLSGCDGLSRGSNLSLFSDRGRFLGTLKQLNWMTWHDGRDRMLVDELGMTIPSQQHAKIVKPSHDALQFNTIHKEDRERRLILADVIEEGVL
jgi:hypothetical protein